MVRWSDGFNGGLIAGLIVALYYVIVGSAIVHDTSFTDFFARIPIAIFHDPIAKFGALAVVLGIVIHFGAAALLGIIYAVVASKVRATWTAPTSVLCGISYGLIVYFVIYDVTVPVLNVFNTMPLWESILGSVLFFGLVLSEYITIAHRRHIAQAPAA